MAHELSYGIGPHNQLYLVDWRDIEEAMRRYSDGARAYRSVLESFVVVSFFVSADAFSCIPSGTPGRPLRTLRAGWQSLIRAVNWAIRPEALNRGGFGRKYLKHSLEVRGLQYLHESWGRTSQLEQSASRF